MMDSDQKRRILALSLLAGLIAGGILAALNIAIVQPSRTLLVEGIIDDLMADGEFDEEEFDSQAMTAYLGQTVGAAAMGLAAGALVGGAAASSGRNVGITEALLIAGIAWFVLYAVPATKYPPSPVAMFSSEAAAEYYPLYLGYLSLSGLAAMGVVVAFKKVQTRNKIFGMAAVYLLTVAIGHLVFPPYEGDSSFDQSILNSWRALTSATMAAFWFSAGAISAALWKFGLNMKEQKNKKLE